MFTALTQPWQRTWLIALLVLWAVLLFGGFVFGRPDVRGRRMPRWMRIASSVVLVVAGWSWYAFSRETAAAGYALLIALGMTVGFLGDLAMAGLIPGGRNIIAGAAGFGVGHVFYITAMLRFGAAIGWSGSLRWLVLALWLLAATGGWYIVVPRTTRLAGKEMGTLHWVTLPYSLLLATSAGLGSGLALAEGQMATLALGTALFLISDLLIAGELFGCFWFPLIDDAIWLTYGPAQMLIVYSVAAVLSRR